MDRLNKKNVQKDVPMIVFFRTVSAIGHMVVIVVVALVVVNGNGICN